MSAAVLVVDDETDLVRTYERVLRRQGYRVISAGSRQDALTALGSHPLDLVVTDVRLGAESGLDVVRAARRTRPGPPVIVVTGYASKAGRHEALAAGAADYLAKPFLVAQLVGAVETVLRLTRSAERPASACVDSARVDGSGRDQVTPSDASRPNQNR